MASSNTDSWSPQYGTTTFTNYTSETPMSPSRYSYTSDSHRQSSDGDDGNSAQNMRRITVSPSPSQQNSDQDSYTDDNSIDEVEATLNDLENDLDNTEQALSEWSHSTGPTPTYTSSSYTGSPSYLSLPSLVPQRAAPIVSDPRMRLSRITERTEESRPNSGAFSMGGTVRPASATPDAFRRSALLAGTSSHSRGSTDSDLPPPGRANELIAVFETNSPGHTRTASAPGARSPSPYFASQTTTNLPSATSYGYGSSTGYGYGSRPSSPTKSRSGTSGFLSPLSTTMESRFRTLSPAATESRLGTGSYLSPSTYTAPPSTFSNTNTNTNTNTDTNTNTNSYTATNTGAPSTFTNTLTANSNTYTGTADNTFTNTGTYTVGSGTFTGTSTTPTSTLRRPQTSPRSPLASVRNIVALWKERTPATGRSTGKSFAPGSSTSISPPPTDTDGLFGIRRRAQRVGARLRETGQAARGDPITPTRGDVGDDMSIRSTGLPPTFNAADFTAYTQSNEAPLHIGLLWYLNVHATLRTAGKGARLFCTHTCFCFRGLRPEVVGALSPLIY
ncbi:hypothetical protein BD779DRAFT_1131471 [Infundibulicybe gibba]|nr:hypothetical protein BD779DRAFT_1131471 [Infundibulicybe gibba]